MEQWIKDLQAMNEWVRSQALEVVLDVIDKRSDEVLNILKELTPTGQTGGLKNSLVKKNASKGTEIGYRIIYDGYDANGRPYQVIANSLNRGFQTPSGGLVAGYHFIDKAVSALKGLDDEINKTWSEKMNK